MAEMEIDGRSVTVGAVVVGLPGDGSGMEGVGKEGGDEMTNKEQ